MIYTLISIVTFRFKFGRIYLKITTNLIMMCEYLLIVYLQPNKS